MSAPVPDRQAAAGFLARARAMRADWLIALASGMVSIDDLLTEAATPSGRPLTRISLRQILLAQPGWGQRRTTGALQRLAASLPTPPAGRMTAGWLLDPRSGGARYLAWCDALSSSRPPIPWPGFPYAPAPDDCRSGVTMRRFAG